MVQGIIIRGTTPKHDFELPYPIELIEEIRVIYGQNEKAKFVKTKGDCTFNENFFSVSLSQEETFLFIPKKNLHIEIRIKLVDGQVITSEEPIVLRVLGTMDEEVIE